MRLPADLARRIARLERYGFTARQAHALAAAGYDVWLVDAAAFLFGSDPCKYDRVIPIGGTR